ncbi:MAG TPA: hypothetical protein EYP07_01605 [Kiloniellaceae bacterium]|nr:hypothetical protein [Kiloniellaceae bacterium]
MQELHPKSIGVTGTNFQYGSVKPLSVISAKTWAKVNAGVSGRMKSYAVWLELGSTQGSMPGFEHAMPHHAAKRTFPVTERPKLAEWTDQLSVPAVAWQAFVVAQCNDLVADLRKSGQSDEQIFSKDRVAAIRVRAAIKVEFSGVSGPNEYDPADAAIGEIKVICKAQAAAMQVNADALLKPTRKGPTVAKAKLDVFPKTHKGPCPAKVNLVLNFEGESAGDFKYLMRVFKKKDAATPGAVVFGDGIHIANVGPFQDKTAKKSNGSFRTTASHHLDMPLKKTQIGGLTAKPVSPLEKTTYTFQAELLGPKKVKSETKSFVLDCGAVRNPAIGGGPGGMTTGQSGLNPDEMPNLPTSKPTQAQVAPTVFPDLRVEKLAAVKTAPKKLRVRIRNDGTFAAKATKLYAAYKKQAGGLYTVSAAIPALKSGASAWVTVVFKDPVKKAKAIENPPRSRQQRQRGQRVQQHGSLSALARGAGMGLPCFARAHRARA